MKRVICFILLVMCLPLFNASAANEENLMRAGVDVVAVPGQTVLYPIYMESETQIASCKIFVTADTTIFSAEPASTGYRIEKGTVTKNGTLFANIYGGTGWQINWFHTKNTTANGVFCYLPLQVAEDAEPGDYKVCVSCSAPNTIDQDGNEVSFSCVSGSIRVVSSEPTIYTEAAEVSVWQTVDVEVKVRNNPGATSMHLILEENGQFQLVRNAEGEVECELADAYANGNLQYSERRPGHWEFLWYSTAAVETDGPFLTLRLKILADVGETIQVPLEYNVENTLTIGDQKQTYLLQIGDLEVTNQPVIRAAGVAEAERVLVDVEFAPGATGEGLLLILAVYDEDGRCKACMPVEGQTEHGVKSVVFPVALAETDTMTLFVLVEDTLIPAMQKIELTEISWERE